MEIFRKKITINILFIVIFSSFFLVIFNISLDFKSNLYRSDYSDKKIDNKYNLRPVDGDIIFRVGKSFWTPFFVKANQRNGFSHLGVVIYDNEIPYVVHIESDDLNLEGGIKKTPLNIFISESSDYLVKKNIMPLEIKRKFIYELQKMSYLNIKFDSQFEIDDEGSKLYCTELIWLAAKRAGLENFGRLEFLFGKPLILVDSIFESIFLGESYLPSLTPTASSLPTTSM